MSAVEILLGAVEPIGLRLRQGASIVTGATIRARVLRSSDGKELDWSTNSFVAAGSAVQPRRVLTETPAASGLYEASWDTSTITNPTTPDTYLVEFDQTAPVVRAFLRQSEVRVRSSQALTASVWAEPQGGAAGTMGAAMTLARQFITNRCEEVSGNPGSITLYSDDGSSQLLQWSLRDSSGGAVISTTGQPARRGAAT